MLPAVQCRSSAALGTGLLVTVPLPGARPAWENSGAGLGSGGVGWGRALISLPWPTAGKQEGLGWLLSLLTPEQGMAIVTCVMWGAGVGGARVCEREQDLEGHS